MAGPIQYNGFVGMTVHGRGPGPWTYGGFSQSSIVLGQALRVFGNLLCSLPITDLYHVAAALFHDTFTKETETSCDYTETFAHLRLLSIK